MPRSAPSPTTPDPIGHGRWVAPFGPIGLGWQGGRVLRVALTPTDVDSTPVPDWLAAAFRAWFADPRQTPCPTAATGTAFQQRVWALIAAIPAGTTRTYAALARDLNSSPRAVGGACRANPLPLLVPCHRVVGVRGLGGFAGDRDGRLVGIKRWLLRHEGVVIAS